MAQTGQLGGTELLSQLGRSGIEAYMQSAQLATELQQQQRDALAGALLGRQPTLQEIITARAAGMTEEEIGKLGSGGLFSSLGFGDAPTPPWIKSIGDIFGF